MSKRLFKTYKLGIHYLYHEHNHVFTIQGLSVFTVYKKVDINY